MKQPDVNETMGIVGRDAAFDDTRLDPPSEDCHGFDFHAQRTAWLAGRLCAGLGLDRALTGRVLAGSFLHDLGKRFVDPAILEKPRTLTPEERRAVERHAALGSSLLRRISMELGLKIEAEIEILRGHHERWDGHGYPDRLRREAIPLGARVVAVADTFDALVSPRPYKPAWPLDSVFDYIQGHSGRRFDPLCVDALLLVRWQVTDAFHDPSFAPESALPEWIEDVKRIVATRRDRFRS